MKESKSWEITLSRVLTIYANLIFAILWVGFILALVLNTNWMYVILTWVEAQPVFLKVVIWILILPVMVGLWIWESTWPVWGQVLGVLGLVGWTALAVSNIPKYFPGTGD